MVGLALAVSCTAMPKPVKALNMGVIPPVGFPVGGLVATVTMAPANGGGVYTFDMASATNLGDFVGPSFTMHHYRLMVAGCPLRLYFNPDAASPAYSGRIELMVEFGTAFSGSPYNLIYDPSVSYAYSVVLKKNGTTILTQNVPVHYWWTRWRYQSARRPIANTPATIMSNGWHLPMSQTPYTGITYPFTNNSSGSTWDPGKGGPGGPVVYTGPMSLAGIYPAMGATGERDDLGAISESQGQWLINPSGVGSPTYGSVTYANAFLDWAEGSNAIPNWYRDETSSGDTLINLTTYPGANSYGAYGQGGLTPFVKGIGWLASNSPAAAIFTAEVAGAFSGSTTSGTTMIMGSGITGTLWPGDYITGSDGTNTIYFGVTIVSQLTGTPGGSPGATFQMSGAANPGNLTSCTMSSQSGVMNVTAVASGVVGPYQQFPNGALQSRSILSQLSGTPGGIGTYAIDGLFGYPSPITSQSMDTIVLSPVVMDESHYPNTASIAALATWDPCFIEAAQKDCNDGFMETQYYNFYSLYGNFNHFGFGNSPVIQPQITRDAAWAFRSLINAWFVTHTYEQTYGAVPAWLLPSSVFLTLLKSNCAYFTEIFITQPGVTGANVFPAFSGNIGRLGQNENWQNDYFNTSMMLGQLLETTAGVSTGLTTLFAFALNNTLWRTNGTSGWPVAYCGPYFLANDYLYQDLGPPPRNGLLPAGDYYLQSAGDASTTGAWGVYHWNKAALCRSVFTGYISGTTLTVTAISTDASELAAASATFGASAPFFGSINPGPLSGAGVTIGTHITTQGGSPLGQVGTYTVDTSQTVGSSGSPITMYAQGYNTAALTQAMIDALAIDQFNGGYRVGLTASVDYTCYPFGVLAGASQLGYANTKTYAGYVATMLHNSSNYIVGARYAYDVAP
jgi:hypothetical protein